MTEETRIDKISVYQGRLNYLRESGTPSSPGLCGWGRPRPRGYVAGDALVPGAMWLGTPSSPAVVGIKRAQLRDGGVPQHTVNILSRINK